MSIYVIETTSRFDKEFKKLDRYTQRMIKGWIDKNLVGEETHAATEKAWSLTVAANGGIE